MSPNLTSRIAVVTGASRGIGYATFELTSLSLLKHWTWAVVIVDVSWGVFVTAVSSTAGLMIADWVAKKA